MVEFLSTRQTDVALGAVGILFALDTLRSVVVDAGGISAEIPPLPTTLLSLGYGIVAIVLGFVSIGLITGHYRTSDRIYMTVVRTVGLFGLSLFVSGVLLVVFRQGIGVVDEKIGWGTAMFVILILLFFAGELRSHLFG